MPSREATEPAVETHRAETVHGVIEYETVRCANCRHELQSGDDVPVGVGLRETGALYVGEHTNRAYGTDEVTHLCSYCAESTLGYESREGRFDTLTAKTASLSLVERAVLFLGSLAVLGLFVLTLVGGL